MDDYVDDRSKKMRLVTIVLATILVILLVLLLIIFITNKMGADDVPAEISKSNLKKVGKVVKAAGKTLTQIVPTAEEVTTKATQMPAGYPPQNPPQTPASSPPQNPSQAPAPSPAQNAHQTPTSETALQESMTDIIDTYLGA